MTTEIEIVKTYGPPPYYAIYMTGMVLPYGYDHTGKPYNPENDPDAELYAGPFETWELVMNAVHKTALADPIWKWGLGSLFASKIEAERLIAAKGKPRTEPTIF